MPSVKHIIYMHAWVSLWPIILFTCPSINTSLSQLQQLWYLVGQISTCHFSSSTNSVGYSWLYAFPYQFQHQLIKEQQQQQQILLGGCNWNDSLTKLRITDNFMILNLPIQKHGTYILSSMFFSNVSKYFSPGPGSIWLDLYLKGTLSFDAFENELFFPTAIF